MRIIEFFSIFKLHYKHKAKIFKIRYFTKMLPLMKILLKYNFITRISIKKPYIFICPNTDRLFCSTKTLKLLYKPSNPRKITLKTLQKLEGTKYSQTLILMTNKGLLTSASAFAQKIGGILLFKIV